MSSASERAIPPAVWRVAGVIVVGAFMAGLDTSLVNVGLDTIAHELRARLVDAQWITSGYLLALAAALPICPWLQRRFGAERVWIVAVGAFTVASALCAVATGLPMLVLFRVLQGVAGGLVVPAGQAILGRVAGPARMGRVMAITGIPVVLAPAIGPAIGGLLIGGLSWRWLFLVNIPVGVVALLLGTRILPRSDRSTPRLDVVGLMLLGLGLPALTSGIIRLGDTGRFDPVGFSCTLVGLVLLALFVPRGVGRRTRIAPSRPPVIDLSLFRRPRYALAQVTVLFTGVSLFGGLIVLPLYYEVLRHVGVVQTGLLLLAYGGGAVVALPIGGWITDRVGGGVSASIGLVVTIAATVPFILLPADADLLVVEALQLVRGVGVGLAGLPAMSSAFREADGRIEDATTTANVLQRIGGTLGSALLVVVIERSDPDPAVAFRNAFIGLSVGALLALIAALALARFQARPSA